MSPRTRQLIVAAGTFFVVVILFLLVYQISSCSKGNSAFGLATRELDAANYDKAIEQLTVASRQRLDSTKLAMVYANRGWAFYRKGLDDNALRDFSESIRLNSKPPYIYLDRALVYRRTGQLERAISDYAEALARNPNLADAYAGRGALFFARGDNERAISDFGESIRCQPGNAQTYVDRGMAFAASDRLDEAIANFDSAISLNPYHAGAYIQRAAAYGRKGDWAKGLVDVSEAIRRSPNARQLWYARAFILLDRGMVEESISDSDTALRIAPDYDLGFMTRAGAYAMSRDWDKALSDVDRALELNPDLAHAHYLRGRAMTAKGEFDVALEQFNQAAKSEPGFVWAMTFHGIVRGYRREFPLALQELRTLSERYPGSAVPHLGLAWFLATCPEEDYRDGGVAIAEALQACEITHWSEWQTIDVLGAAYAEARDFDKAIEFGKLALTLPGSSPMDRIWMEEKLALYAHGTPIRDFGSSAAGRDLIDEGIRAYAQGNDTRALKCFNAVLPSTSVASSLAALSLFFNPNETGRSNVPWAVPKSWSLTNAYYYRGLTHQRQHEWQEAIGDFTTVLSREPNSTLTLCDRGVTYDRIGETEQALRDFNEVIRLKPTEGLAYMLRADTRRSTGQLEAALKDCAAALRLDPGLGMAHHIRAEVYLVSGDDQNAIKEFDAANRADRTDHAQNIRDRAEVFRIQGNYKLALIELREAVRQFPKSAAAHNSLAWFLATCSDDSYRNGIEALTQAQSACELSQWNVPGFVDTLAAAYAETGDFEHATQYATMAVNAWTRPDRFHEAFQDHLSLFQRGIPYHQDTAGH